MQTAEIRRRFLEHFAQRGHTVVPSASLVSPDPSLLFTVAGMVPFIPYLTGREPAPYPRATSVQKCVRTLDIEEVGKTTRHGTFFQMNGNFSFGDYFKEGAIQHAWELITGSVEDGGLGFDPDTIWATVYLDDDEAADAWHRIAGLPKERIQRLGKKDNYWHTGAPGPAGPCSEIYVDRGPEFGPDGGPAVDTAGDRFLEIWNLVFMQYEIDEVQSKEEFRVLGELPKKNIDTGMGLERVAFLLQGVDNMYEIDEVAPVLRRAAELAGVTYGRDHEADVRLRVVADHVRSGLMLIGDGITPGNEGRGYILRRLLRRAVRSMKLLGVEDATLPELLPVSRDAMSASYPELATDFARISAVAYAEEEAFRRTLSRRDDAVRHRRRAGQEGRHPGALRRPGVLAARHLRLPDRRHPRDGRRAGRDRRRAGLPRAHEAAARPRPRRLPRQADRLGRRPRLPAAAGRPRADRLAGLRHPAHRLPRARARLRRRRRRRRAEVAAPGEITRVVLDRTPFYAESGGQVADAGVLTWDGGRAEVLDVQRPVKGLVVHQVRVLEGELREGAELAAEVDYDWRLVGVPGALGHARRARRAAPGARPAGAAVGLLQPARATCGWTSPGRARSPSSSAPTSRTSPTPPSAPTTAVTASYMTLPEARAFGALALFGETYGEQVARRRDRRPVVARALRWHPRARQRADRHAGADRRVVGRLRVAPRGGGRRSRGLPLPGARARPGPAARRPAEVAAGRAGRAGQRHARPAARRRQGARRAAVAAVGRRGRSARRRRARTSTASRWSPARRPASAAATCGRSRSTSAAGFRATGRPWSCWRRSPVARWLSWPR